ncbi:MAG: hypothetical protein ACN6OP_27135, partial [Pseudomonadales bacterium]
MTVIDTMEPRRTWKQSGICIPSPRQMSQQRLPLMSVFYQDGRCGNNERLVNVPKPRHPPLLYQAEQQVKLQGRRERGVEASSLKYDFAPKEPVTSH